MPRSLHGGRHELGQNFLSDRPTIDHPLDAPVVVGNIPFHLTTPILRRVVSQPRWRSAVLLTQWEVARKRAGVGGGTMLTAQTAPWLEFGLHGRVPAGCFIPRPSVDGGLLVITRRPSPLIPDRERRDYEAFVRAVFTGPGGSLTRVVRGAAGVDVRAARRAIADAGIRPDALPRSVVAAQWAALWTRLRR